MAMNQEKRRELRMPCEKPGRYLKMAAEESFEEGSTTVKNFSSEGMLLDLPRAYDPGSIIELRLPDPRDGQFTAILEARWSQADPQSSKCLIGCRVLFASFS